MASLLDLLDSLLRDPMVKASYDADPEKFLSDHGWGELDEHDLAEALVHVADAEPPGIALHMDPTAGLTSLAEYDAATAENPYAEPETHDGPDDFNDSDGLDAFDPSRDFAPDSPHDAHGPHEPDGHDRHDHADAEHAVDVETGRELPPTIHEDDRVSHDEDFDREGVGDVLHDTSNGSHVAIESDVDDAPYTTGLFDVAGDDLDTDDASAVLGDDFDFD